MGSGFDKNRSRVSRSPLINYSRRSGLSLPGSGPRPPKRIFTASYQRRRRAQRAPLLLLLVILLIGAIWLWMRPVSLVVAADVADARVTLGSKTATGAVTYDRIDAGIYTATASRTGYATTTVEVEAKRFRRNTARITLRPLEQRVDIAARPTGAKITILRGKTALVTATSRLQTDIPSGPITIKVERTGSNPYSRDLFIDGPLVNDVLLDPVGQIVHKLGLLPCSGAPKAVAITPDGRQAWATILDGPPSIEVFDVPTMKKVGGIDLGKFGAVEIVFNRQGTRAYASQMETAKVFEIDVATLKVLRSFPTRSAWTKVVLLSPDETSVFAANWSGDDVSRISMRSGSTEERYAAPDTPRGLWASDDRTLWVAGFENGDLWRIDLPTRTNQKVFKSGGALRHLVGDRARGVMFSSDMAKDCVWVTNVDTGATKRFVKVDHKPNTIDLSPDGKVLFVACRGENNSKSYYLPGPEWGSILLFDAVSGKPLDAIVGGNQCTALDVSDDGRILVFSDFLDNRLRVYEIPPYETLMKGKGGRFATHKNDLKK